MRKHVYAICEQQRCRSGYVDQSSATYQVSRSSAFWFQNFSRFYHIWVWWPSWSCDLDRLNKLLLPHPTEAPQKFGFNRPSGFLEKEVWKCWTGVTLDQGQWMTLTFDVHIGSCTHLVNCIYQVWHHRLKYFLKYPLFYLFPIQKHTGPNLTVP